MANSSFSEILVRIGFNTNEARRHEFILDSMIAEEIKQTSSKEVLSNDLELHEIIKKEMAKTYTDYLEYVTQGLHLSQQLLAKEKLEEYLGSI